MDIEAKRWYCVVVRLGFRDSMVEQSGEFSQRAEFERLTFPHLSSLYNTAVWLTGRQHDAQDLVQETLLTAYRFFSRFTPGTNYRAWLFTILRNLHRNFFRSQKREPAFVPWEEVEATIRATDPLNWERRLDENPGIFDLEEAVAELPEEYRLPLLLTEVERFSYTEIAETLQIPMGTVKSRISRGKQLLKSLLLKQVKRSRIREA